MSENINVVKRNGIGTVPLILFPIASVDLVLLVFAYRDFSLGLLAMSVVAIVIYPVSILLIYLNRPVYTSDLKPKKEDSISDKCKDSKIPKKGCT